NWRVRIAGQGQAVRVRRGFFGLNIPLFRQFRISVFNEAWNPANEKAVNVGRSQAATLGIADFFFRRSGSNRGFRIMEGDPHGMAHVSFRGPVNNPGTAPADPIFFLLHCNVDRLWALWQFADPDNRYDASRTDTYPHHGRASQRTADEDGVGNFLEDTLWPWNNDTLPSRPPTAPGGRFTSSVNTPLPGDIPRLIHAVDYQGQHQLDNDLGFAYDDVPFEFNTAPIV
ncbi:MAG: tyrosinase family protein, partial [Verrucomicrobiota bacterium]